MYRTGTNAREAGVGRHKDEADQGQRGPGRSAEWEVKKEQDRNRKATLWS